MREEALFSLNIRKFRLREVFSSVTQNAEIYTLSTGKLRGLNFLSPLRLL